MSDDADEPAHGDLGFDPVAPEGGCRTIGSSGNVRDPDGQLLECMTYPDKPKEHAHAG
jgi:hypothetical protein